MDLDLQDRVYLVTGGSRGIGHAVASALSAEGAHVVVCARDARAAQEAARVAGATMTSECADVTDAGSVRALVESIGERHGRLDGIVHNAGRFGGGPLEGVPREGLEDGLGTKVSGPLGLTQAALDLLRAGDRSAIVSVSGVTAQRVVPGAAATAIVWLLSAASSFVNGISMRVDGGQLPAVDA